MRPQRMQNADRVKCMLQPTTGSASWFRTVSIHVPVHSDEVYCVISMYLGCRRSSRGLPSALHSIAGVFSKSVTFKASSCCFGQAPTFITIDNIDIYPHAPRQVSRG